DSMDDGHVVGLPATLNLGGDVRHLLFGHLGVGVIDEVADALAARVVTDDPLECDDPAVAAGGGSAHKLTECRVIEWIACDAHQPCHAQPPPKGGMNTSPSPGASTVSAVTYARLTATAHAGSRRARVGRRSAKSARAACTVAPTPRSSDSASSPAASRSEA